MARYVSDGEQPKIEEMNETVKVEEENKKEQEVEQYAHMFAEWDLVPPQMVIRRIRRNHQ